MNSTTLRNDPTCTIKEHGTLVRVLAARSQQSHAENPHLQERVKTLEGQQAKNSQNSSLPPSSDRFVHPPKSLRQKSGKKPGGQQAHRGHHLRQVEIPDEVRVHTVEACEDCQHDLCAYPASLPERRQVMDLPLKRLWVTEHRVEENSVSSAFI